MGQYKVKTEICTLGAVGDTVDIDDTPAVAALVNAGHLSRVKAKKADQSTDTPAPAK